MSNLLYLLIAVALSLLGSFVLWLMNRQPRSMEAGIEKFARELQALKPDAEQRQDRGRDR